MKEQGTSKQKAKFNKILEDVLWVFLSNLPAPSNSGFSAL